MVSGVSDGGVGPSVGKSLEGVCESKYTVGKSVSKSGVIKHTT